ncbi:hypothetical protein [Zavarzinella formosa]|uniref:hypothetical protein n=1 Tax=Zavarzinella formosa TaxID=360055 RepID=UPI0002F7BB28|nr:hypothetical protein [Zavarzinella formosa]
MTTLWRTAVIAIGGIGGFCAGGAGWFVAGTWWGSRLEEQYPPAGAVDMPSPEVVGALFLTILGAPVAAVVGGIAGAAITGLLVGGRAKTEQIAEPDPPA